MAMASSKQQTTFYGVYLLCSQSTEQRFQGRCYVGFTVNPERRIRQHNRGKEHGGAKKTDSKGPWKMLLIVHGFPNNIAALQFEWAWQNPKLSTRLKHFAELKRKKPRETHLQYHLRILSRMLNVGPWCRLCLTIQWLESAYEQPFQPCCLPPAHMRILSGALTNKDPCAKKAEVMTQLTVFAPAIKACQLCQQIIEQPQRSGISCLNSSCKLLCHIICLGNYFIAADVRSRGHYIPIGGQCPLCLTSVTWGELLQHKAKLQRSLSGMESGGTDDEEVEDDDDLDSEAEQLQPHLQHDSFYDAFGDDTNENQLFCYEGNDPILLSD